MTGILDTVITDVGKVIDVFGKAPLTPTEADATVAGKITVSDLRGALSVAKATSHLWPSDPGGVAFFDRLRSAY